MEEVQKLFESEKFKHHVYGFESHGLQISDFEKFINKNRFSYIFSRSYDSFLINDARSIKSLIVEKTEKESLFIISFSHINEQTQNTLLKIIEEPYPKTTFFFIFPSSEILLPTIRSRMEVIRLNNILNKKERRIEVENFIKLPLNERFIISKELNRQAKKNENFYKITKEEFQVFLDDLEIFYTRQEKSKQRNSVLQTIYLGRKYITSNGSSIKMLMDMISVEIG